MNFAINLDQSCQHKVNASGLHFARSFQGHPTWPYLARSNMCPNTAKYGNLGAYLGTPNIVKCGVPKKNTIWQLRSKEIAKKKFFWTP